jgi:hypothetical protein
VLDAGVTKVLEQAAAVAAYRLADASLSRIVSGLMRSLLAQIGNVLAEIPEEKLADRQTALAYFHLVSKVLDCATVLPSLVERLKRLAMIAEDNKRGGEPITELLMTATAIEDIDCLAKHKTGTLISPADAGDSISLASDVKDMYLSEDGAGGSASNNGSQDNSIASSKASELGKKSEKDDEDSEDSSDDDGSDSEKSNKNEKVKKNLKTTLDLNVENCDSPISPVSLQIPKEDKAFKLTINESYPQDSIIDDRKENSPSVLKTDQFLDLEAAIKTDPNFDLRLLSPSNMLLVPTLAKLSVNRIEGVSQNRTSYFASDQFGLPYSKLDEAWGLNAAYLQQTCADWTMKFYSKTEQPQQLWFDVFKKPVYGSIFGDLALPSGPVYPARKALSYDWIGNSVLDAIQRRDPDVSAAVLKDVLGLWKPVTTDEDCLLFNESSPDLWLKLEKINQTRIESPITSEEEVPTENKFAFLKSKLRAKKTEEIPDESTKKLKIPVFFLDNCPTTSKLTSVLPGHNKKLIESELLQRLIQELFSFNLTNQTPTSADLETIAEAAFSRHACLEFYEKSNLEPSTVYCSSLADRLTLDHLASLRAKTLAGLKTANEWLLLGRFRLVRQAVNRAIAAKQKDLTNTVNASLVFCFDLVDGLLRLELKNCLHRRTLLLDVFEWFHVLFEAKDPVLCRGILDDRADVIDEMMDTINMAYFDGFLNSCEDTGDYLEAMISFCIRSGIVSKEKVEGFKSANSRFHNRLLSGFRDLSDLGNGRTFEELHDQFIRGILMQKATYDNEKTLPHSTKYVVASRIPLKISLSLEYSEYALRDLKQDKNNKEEKDEEDESGVSCQIYEPSNPSRKINIAQVYAAFNQNDITIVPELPSNFAIEDWPIRDCQIEGRDIVVVFPPVSRNCYILTEEEGEVILDETRMEQLAYYYDPASPFNDSNKIDTLWDSTVVSGYIYANNGLLNNSPISLTHFSESGLFFYSDSLHCFELFCPYNENLQRKFKAFAESDRVFFQLQSPLTSKATRIVSCQSLVYYVLFEDGMLLRTSYFKEGYSEMFNWEKDLWQMFGDPEQLRSSKLSEIEEIANNSNLPDWDNSVDNQYKLFNLKDIGLKDIAVLNDVAFLLLSHPSYSDDHNLVTVFFSKERRDTLKIPNKPVKKFIAGNWNSFEGCIILFEDGSLTVILLTGGFYEKKITVKSVESHNITSLAIMKNKVCILAASKIDLSQIGLYCLDTIEEDGKSTISLVTHNMSSVFQFNEKSKIHNAPLFFATECTVNPYCVFNKNSALLDYPLSFRMKKSDKTIVFKNYAGDPEFYSKFMEEDVEDDSISFLLTGPCRWTISGEKSDDCRLMVETFLKMYMESSPMTEGVEKTNERIYVDGSDTEYPTIKIDFSGPCPPRVLLRVKGEKREGFKALSQLKFECSEIEPVYFDILPNFVLMKGLEWNKYKEESRSHWEPELQSISPSQWIEVKDTLVDLTWNIAFDDNPYSSKVYSETHKISTIKTELKDLLETVPYFNSHPQVKIDHLISAHCAVALIDYWNQCYTLSSRFVRRKPVTKHLDKCFHNMFGSTINEMRFNFNFCDSIGNFEMQVDRYRAEKSTEVDQNQSFLNQLYYQIMVKANWNSVLLKKVEGFELNFVGEDGYDAGGLLKEYFSKISSEVINNTKLFVPSANFGDAVEENDRYVPNPALLNEKDLMNFYKFGIILGFVFKFFGSLAIDMPSCFWEHLLGKKS